MEGIVATFRQKIGPLEVWMWAAIVVAAILAWMYFTKSGFFSNQSSAGDATQPTRSGYNPATATDTAAGGGGGGLADSLAAPAQGAIVATQPPDSAAFTPTAFAYADPTQSLAAPPGSSASPSPSYAPAYTQVTPGSPAAASITSSFGSIPLIGPILTNVLRGPSPSDPIAANPNNRVPGKAPAGSSRF